VTAVAIVLACAVIAVLVWLALYQPAKPTKEQLRRSAEERLAAQKARNVRRIEKEKEGP
jgi:hypothetical protein